MATETWLLNENPQWIGISSRDFSIQFTSNNQSFTLFRFNRSGANQYDLQYNDVVVNGGTWNSSLNRPNWTGWTNEAYRTITFANAPTGDLLTWLQNNGTKQQPTYKFKHWKKSNVKVNRTLVGQKYYYFNPYTILGLYTITTSLTNCTGASGNATKIQENGDLTLTFTANSGYELPTGVSVTNVTSYNWNKSTGVLAISKPTGDVAIEIVAVSAFTQVPVTLTNPFSSYISINASNAPFGRISNMNKAKIYSIQLTFDYYKNDITYLTYNGTQWVASATVIVIKNQTETSVDLYKGLGGIMTNSLFGVIALEGTTQASVSDFTGFTGTDTMPEYVCLIEGTLVTLADGSTKPIEDITYDDDELLVWNFYDGKFDKAKPCWVTKPQIAHEYNLCKFSNGVEIGFVGQGGDIGYHRIYNDEAKAFTHTGVKETPIGTHTFAQDGSKPTLIEQHIVKKQVRYYNVGTEKHINIFTNGILTSARISNKYAIKDMKYIGNRLISEQEEQEYIRKTLKRC